MVKDPVCKVDVDERSTAWSSTYRNKTYYFSSEQCKADFDRNPENYSTITGTRIASRARSQIGSMITERKDKTAERIVVLSDALHGAAQRFREQNQAAPARYADRAAEKVQMLSDYLRRKDAEQLINETEDFIRQHPGLVIGSALLAGFLTARFLKSSRSVST